MPAGIAGGKSATGESVADVTDVTDVDSLVAGVVHEHGELAGLVVENVEGIAPCLRLGSDGLVLPAAGDDFGAIFQEFHGDAAQTVVVGRGSPEALRLVDATRAALESGIAAARAGGRVGDIGAAAQGSAEGAGFSVVRQFVGHGIGRRLHEPPQVPNFGTVGTGAWLRPGLVQGALGSMPPPPGWQPPQPGRASLGSPAPTKAKEVRSIWSGFWLCFFANWRKEGGQNLPIMPSDSIQGFFLLKSSLMRSQPCWK